MKKLIPIFAVILIGCSSTPEKKTSVPNVKEPSEKRAASQLHSQQVMPSEHMEVNINNITLPDGKKVTLEEFSKLNEAGGDVTLKFYIDESGQTNAIAEVVK